jgi:intracellular sulfur oxidation DsrE/DsrF family protein
MRELFPNTSRRGFLGKITAGAAAIGAASLSPFTAGAKKINNEFFPGEDPDDWIKKIPGKHKIVFDVPEPHGIFPFAWPRVFMMTNEMSGAAMKDVGVIVVLRHSSIPYAMQDQLWAKYNFGDVFKIDDPVKKVSSATRNPLWQPKPGDYSVPGIGNVAIGINELQQNGVQFCVCDMAIMVNSAVIASKMNMDAETVKKDFIAGLLPGIHRVPSGVWALGRAQEQGFGYIYAS